MEKVQENIQYWPVIRPVNNIAQKCGADGARILEAFEYALQLHKDQKRKSGEPYITHPVSVTEIIAREFEILDISLLCAALLHDVVEDVSGIDLSDIEKRFGKTVADLVDGCTKIRFSPGRSGNSTHLTHSKILLTASRRLGVLIIKLADRLHNLRTLHHLPVAKRQRIAVETLDIYAPLAAKLNIYHLKRELYNLALMYRYPKKSKKILNHIKKISDDTQTFEIRTNLEKALRVLPVKVQVRSRCKGLGSYYNRDKKNLEVHNAENYVDFTIIVETQDEFMCYQALGIVNAMYPPLPRTVRDFIASPKANGYRSLHVRFHYGGQNYLVKIRTPSMDTWALYGVLRRWREDKEFFREEHDKEIAEFLREIGEYEGPGPHRKELLQYTQAEEIAVYTPKGDLYYLPKQSTVLDFAYRIHSELGDHCSGAIVDGQKVSPMYALSDGTTVEVLTTLDVLDVDPEYEAVCKTPRAKAGIHRLIQGRRKSYAEKIGKGIFDQILEQSGINSQSLDSLNMHSILQRVGAKTESELYFKLGQDFLAPNEVRKIVNEVLMNDKMKKSDNKGGDQIIISVGQLDRAVHKFAHCCRPYPGEDNCTAVLSERGVTIHRGDCIDAVTRHSIPQDRLFKVRWLLDTVWDSALVFTVTVYGVSLGNLLSNWPRSSAFEILELKQQCDRYGQPSTVCLVKMKTLRDAKQFFGTLTSSFSIVVENYCRSKAINGYRP